MINKEYTIIEPFVKEPWKKFTFNEIKNITKSKSQNYTHKILKKFVASDILAQEKAGNVILYKLSRSLKANAYVGFIAEYNAWHKKQIPHKSLESIADKIPIGFYTFIITGSYARNKQKPTSDIDVAIIIDDAAESKKIYAQLRQACELSTPPIHLYVFKRGEFLQMLLNKEANYGKEIAKNNLILFGAEYYFKIMNEAIQHGFNG